MDNKEQCRAEFEVWAELEGYASEGEYPCPVDLMHKAWQAAWNRRAPAPQAAHSDTERLAELARGLEIGAPLLTTSPGFLFLLGKDIATQAKAGRDATSPAPAVVQMTDEQIDRTAGCNGLYRAMTPDDQTCKSMVKRFVTDILSASGVRHE